ncbi:hypothetical protein B0H15DRAFT_804133 [Mycena belliarum]|uniref:Uncharacterized protein n=1 Tax=Mycena belliarum TaxID=1033014 RepID=A0AAD6TYS4_9AGAR|nr:hypothetical protein B0H15DRAFT_804133 [Mycena belliae]
MVLIDDYIRLRLAFGVRKYSAEWTVLCCPLVPNDAGVFKSSNRHEQVVGTSAAWEIISAPMINILYLSKQCQELVTAWGSINELLEEEFLTQDFHAVVLILIYPSAPVLPGVLGKTLLIAGPNIVSAENPNPFNTRLNTLLGVKKIPSNKLVNLPRQERNSAGICLTLALEWMVEMVIKGFEVMTDENGVVVVVQNYRQL